LIDNSEIRPIREKLKTSLQNTAKTAKEILQKYFPELNVEITFDKEKNMERNIYFTEEQQEAILDPSEKLVISGVPGSGKSLILMMRIFIAAQDKSKKEISIRVIAALQHRHKYGEFLNANVNSFLRQCFLSSATESDANPFALDKTDCDFFCDEVSPNQISAYCASLKDQTKATLVLSSVYENQHDLSEAIDQLKGKLIELKTHFRGTKQIAKYWQEYYLRNGGKLEVGHNFDGIQPEIYPFSNIDECAKAMKRRIRRLQEIEGCNREDFAITFQSADELNKIGEKLRNEKYNLYLKKETLPTFSQNPSSIIASLIKDWKMKFQRAFKSAATNDLERAATANDFHSFTLILLEAKSWNFCDERLKEDIDQTFQFFLEELEKLKDERNRRKEWELRSVETGEWIYGWIVWLNLWKELLESSQLQCWEMCRIERNLPSFVSRAIQILKERQNKTLLQSSYQKENEIYIQMAQYFREFQLINTWPQMFSFGWLPSVQFPIQIVFIDKKNKNDANIKDFLSVAFSR
jgi:hypothetical protein